MYEKINAQYEKWTQSIYFVCVNATLPIDILPNLLVCYFNYYIMDQGNDAFHLPYPEWYGSLDHIEWQFRCLLLKKFIDFSV